MIKLERLRLPVILFLVWLGCVIGHWLLGEVVAVNVERSLLFHVRGYLGRGPGLDERIKVFAIDDPSVAAMKTADPPLGDWATVFAALERAGAAGVMIDRIFDKSFTSADLQEFEDRMRQVRIPIISVSFVTNQAIPLRQSLTDPKGLLSGSVRWGLAAEESARSVQVYGPAPDILPYLNRIGHGNYAGDGRVVPIFALADGRRVPHWSIAGLSAVGHAQALPDLVSAIPTNSAGSTLVNFDRPAVYAGRTYAFEGLLRRAKAGSKLSVVAPGDIVVILPGSFTGSADFKETPFGTQPGGVVMLSVLHSLLNKAWLFEPPAGAILILALGGIGTLLGLCLRPTVCVAGLGLATCLLMSASLGGFAYAGVVLPFVFPASALLMSGVIASAHLARGRQLENIRMSAELKTAKAIQAALIPQSKVKFRGVEISGHFQPATECAGDFWTAAAPLPHRYYVAIGDATGHGVGSALVSSMACACLANLAELMGRGAIPPMTGGDVLSSIHRTLRTHADQGASMTATVLVLDMETQTIEVANAAHPAPIIFRVGQPAKNLHLPGDVLGIGDGDLQISSEVVSFAAGDRVLLVSDGVTECVNRSGRALGRGGLFRRFKSEPPGSGTELMDRVIAFVDAHREGVPLDDDVTIVVLEII